ncbi:calcium/proton exchanger [Fervidicella metallireducens]|uniref:calcium/proton exchanger n=1 Tax=Fervidicella metallireducens TaxID=655338 RepID=UPI000552D2ED|nr:calcium/proton exchanger [Fervidicella metallireducens]
MKIKYLYIFLPVSILLYKLNFFTLCFFVTILAVIPISSSICKYTDIFSEQLGDKVGGLLNATAGNIPELIISYFALKSGMFELVKSGLIGSIIGNLLLVEGISIFLGGLKYNEQKFSREFARTNFGLLFLALTGIIIASTYKRSFFNNGNFKEMSYGISIILLLVYFLGLIFSLITHRNLFIFTCKNEEEAIDKNVTGNRQLRFFLTLISFIFTFLFLIIEGNILVKLIEYISLSYGFSQNFLGIIIIPMVGNVAEYSTAILMALKNKINLCIEIAIGSGMQIALFAMPFLVLIGLTYGYTIDLSYNLYQITSLIIAIGLSFFVFQDGKTFWIEGAILLASYFIIALGYLFM